MIKTVSILNDELKNYSNIKSKIQSLCSRGDHYPLVRDRGLYETDGSLPGYCLALIINGPASLDVWSADFFTKIARNITAVQ